MGVEDYFAGLYLAHREALLPFWHDVKGLDLFVRERCGIGAPAWYYWIDFYMSTKNDRRWQKGMILVPRSVTLNIVLNDSAELALKGGQGIVGKPQLDVGHFISAIAAHSELSFTRAMLASGMKRKPAIRRRPRPKPGE